MQLAHVYMQVFRVRVFHPRLYIRLVIFLINSNVSASLLCPHNFDKSICPWFSQHYFYYIASSKFNLIETPQPSYIQVAIYNCTIKINCVSYCNMVVYTRISLLPDKAVLSNISSRQATNQPAGLYAYRRDPIAQLLCKLSW